LSKSRIGGQAVIEGIMLKGKSDYTIAVRDLQNNILLIKNKISIDLTWLNYFPIIRGFAFFIQSLWLGFKSLGISAAIQKGNKELRINRTEMTISLLSAFVIGFSVFFAAPLFIAESVKKIISFPNKYYFLFFEGIIRLSFFILYIKLISRLRDVKRLFSYHGAEHKVINTYENGMELNVENVKSASRFHPRCGTSFILFFFALSTIVFSFITTKIILYKILLRVLMIPLLAGISFEIIYFSEVLPSNLQKIFNIGLIFQRLTTSEPDESQITVAIIALNRLIENENRKTD